MTWKNGRQGTGYQKFLIFQLKNLDVWLLHYPPGASIPWHKDPVQGKEHHRLNIILYGQGNFESRKNRNSICLIG